MKKQRIYSSKKDLINDMFGKYFKTAHAINYNVQSQIIPDIHPDHDNVETNGNYIYSHTKFFYIRNCSAQTDRVPSSNFTLKIKTIPEFYMQFQSSINARFINLQL